MTGNSAPASIPIRAFDVTAQSTDVFGRVLCNARDHHFVVDGPLYNGCPGEELTPPELFLASVASCGVELIHVIAREQQKPLGSVHVRVHGEVDRGRQARSDVTTFTSVHLDFSLTGTDAAAARALVDGFKRR